MPLFSPAGMMKNWFRPSAMRMSRCGMRPIAPVILTSAEARLDGDFVRTAAPRSAANSR